jgi:hypothetical protein
MYEQLAQVAQTNTAVLIRGESGTARAVRLREGRFRRRQRPQEGAVRDGRGRHALLDEIGDVNLSTPRS